MKILLILLLVSCYDGKAIPKEYKSSSISIKEIDSTSEAWEKELCKCGYQPEGIVFDESEPRNKEEMDELLFKIDQRDKAKKKKIKRKKNQI
jgi:hypothetical protein